MNLGWVKALSYYVVLRTNFLSRLINRMKSIGLRQQGYRYSFFVLSAKLTKIDGAGKRKLPCLL